MKALLIDLLLRALLDKATREVLVLKVRHLANNDLLTGEEKHAEAFQALLTMGVNEDWNLINLAIELAVAKVRAE